MEKSTYSLRVLELIAKAIGDSFTGPKIVKILELQGVPKEYIDYPNTKWKTLFDVFQNIKSGQPDPDSKISQLISEFIHPLNHNADLDLAEKLSEKIQKYLSYDKFYITGPNNEPFVIDEKEMDEMHSVSPEFEEKEKKAKIKDEQKIKENKDLIKLILDNHQAYIDILEIFCKNTKKPTKELNDAYLFLLKKTRQLVEQIGLEYSKIYIYVPFKGDLYSAEIEWNGTGSLSDLRIGPKLSWDAIRPSLYRVHSEITKLYNFGDENSNMTDDEKSFEKITNLISQQRIKETPIIKDEVKKMEILHRYEDKKKQEKVLKSSVVRFDDNIPAIFVDEIEIPLPEYGKEHYFCRAMWKRKKEEPIDWSKVYNDMENKKSDFIPDGELWRYVYDAKNDINKRVKEITGTKEDLFYWAKKSVKRLY